jgi:hypothetical protein
MTAEFATVNGVRILSGSILFPLYGAWVGDVVLETPDDIAPNLTVIIGNLTLTGFAFRMAPFAGSRLVRMVGGFGGWRKPLPPKQYQNPAGIAVSLVLGDAAMEVGERVSVPTDGILGTNFVREAAPASRVLRQLAGANWHVTQVAVWPSVAIVSDFQVIDFKAGEGRMTVATEDYASWLPGASFASTFIQGTYDVDAVMYVFDREGTFRMEVLTQ